MQTPITRGQHRRHVEIERKPKGQVGFARSYPPLGARAVLRLDQPQPPPLQRLRGHHRLCRSLPLPRLGYPAATRLARQQPIRDGP